MHKLEDIKPKKYPDEKPSENRAYVNYRVLLDNGTQSLFNWNPISQSDGKMIWNKYVTWFIDIPNPPSELKFLAYPQNKPKEAGLYLAHYKPADDWGDIYYPDENIWDEHIDYFIPVRLDKENEMVFRENIWDTDEMKAEYDKSKPQMVALFDTSYGKPLNTIVVLADELTAFARHWLDLQGYDVVNREPENEKILVRELGERIGYGNLMQLASECWQESLKAKGLPSGGAFSVGLPYDLLIKKESEDE